MGGNNKQTPPPELPPENFRNLSPEKQELVRRAAAKILAKRREMLQEKK